MPLPTMAIPNFAGGSQTVNLANSGRQTAADSSATVASSEDFAAIGALTETAPASDTVSSGLNGRLQRVAQRLTSLIALLPASLGTKTAAASLAVTLASDGAMPVAIGTAADAVVANGAGGTLAGYLRSIKDAVTDTTSSSKVVSGYDEWETVAASQTDQVLGATGATGDRLSHVLIIPATIAAGAVSIKDGAGSAITIFAGGGTTALTTLIPFAVPLGLKSLAGAWKITTGTNVSAIGVGDFT